MDPVAGGIVERIWASVLNGGEKAPLFVFSLIVFASMAWLIVKGLSLIRDMMAKWDKRDVEIAERERETIVTLARIAAPMERIPGVLEGQRVQLEEQGRFMRSLREEMQQGFRALAGEIQTAGEAGRRAWREVADLIRPGRREGPQ